MFGDEKLMHIIKIRRPSFHRKWQIAFPSGYFIFLFFLIGIGSAIILMTIQQAALSSIFLLIIISISGLIFCRNTEIQLNDPSLKILGYLWLIKLGITFFLLYVGWIPQLNLVSSTTWGYDPQRFYIQAQELVSNNWSSAIFNLNYVGILYFYGAIYYIFGKNPVTPALINNFITLFASLYLVKVGYEIKNRRGPRDWTLAFALLLPELLWFDVMTSREMLLTALLLFTTLTVGRYLAGTTSTSLIKVLLVVVSSMLGIAAVRTSMLLPVVATIALMALVIKRKDGSWLVRTATLAAVAVVALIVGPIFTRYLGGYNFDVNSAIQTATESSKNIALSDNVEWAKNSIGILFMPEGLIQSLLFLPPRMLLYLVSPLPNISISISDLLTGSWSAWQFLLTLLSSLINVLVFPYVLASFVQSVKMRKTNAAPLIFHIPYWTIFIAIAGGNLIIQERYRIMASPLLWGCAWLGAMTCSKNIIKRISMYWYGLLAFAALFYLFYKFGYS